MNNYSSGFGLGSRKGVVELVGNDDLRAASTASMVDEYQVAS